MRCGIKGHYLIEYAENKNYFTKVRKLGLYLYIRKSLGELLTVPMNY